MIKVIYQTPDGKLFDTIELANENIVKLKLQETIANTIFNSGLQPNDAIEAARLCIKYKGTLCELLMPTEQATEQATVQVEERKFEECVYLIHFTDEESRVRNTRELMAKLDAEGWNIDAGWDEEEINYQNNVFLRCYKDGKYILHNHDCDFKKQGFPLYHWCGADPTNHRPKVKVGDRVVATTELEDSRGTYPIGFSWDIKVVDDLLEPFLPNREPVGHNEGYRLATKYDV